jgi:dTDP-4-dehydrorhamnose reductase
MYFYPSNRNHRKKILILGASSYIGRHLFTRLGPDLAVAAHRGAGVQGSLYFDALTSDVGALLGGHEVFSHAIILFGITKPDECAGNKEASDLLNVTRTKAAIDALIQRDITPVFASTESVFDGIKGSYVETDPAHPILTYGKQKLEIEEYLRESGAEHLIVRFARVYGTDSGEENIFSSSLKAFSENKKILCAADQVFSPIHISEACEGIGRLLKLRLTGTFHISGRDTMSRLDMLHLILARYRNYHDFRGSIVPRSIHDFPALEKRPLNVSLRPDKIVSASGLAIRPFADWCEVLVTNWMRSHEKRQISRQ